MSLVPEKMNIVPACGNLELIPRDRDKGTVESRIYELTHEENGPEEIEEYYNTLGALRYEPHCKKTGDVCVVMESPVMSQRATGGFYQPFFITVLNLGRIEKCEDHEPNKGRSVMGVDEFLFRHVQYEEKKE
ncbi:MAG: hypothetical protein KKE20_04035 [Nanoarchaeota archaeon]|nr:hypothetical protein [Nanoarchaeota archaeon]